MITHKTFCKICSAYCGIEVDVDTLEGEEKIVAIRGDRDHPMSQGYTCPKGRQWAHQYHNDNRLLKAQTRSSRSEEFHDIDREQALDEVAAKLKKIIEQHGPRAVAIYRGNGLSVSSNGNQVAQAWLAGVGSEMDFSSLTIDQPSKVIATSRHGVWGAGAHSFDSADVCMLIGNNPIISALNMTGGPPGWRPAAVKESKKRGMKLIVVDPRRTETAEYADIYLSIRPGEDVAFIGAVVRLIIAENLYDNDFVSEHTEGFEELKTKVDRFTLEYSAERSGLPAEQIADAARMFAAAKRGTCSSGTGPNMGPFPHLFEHLVLALNTLCGRWNREGDKVAAPSLLSPNVAPPAQPLPMEFLPAMLNSELDTKVSRIRGIKQVFQEMPTAVAAEEILLDGEGQVKALIVIGGNPVQSWPDQQKTIEALAKLELLVSIDIKETPTTRRADYILPAAHGFERDGLAEFTDRLYELPFAQYSRPILKPQGDVAPEWYYLVGLARRMGTKIQLPGGAIPLDNPELETLDVLELMFPDELVKVPVREMAKHEGGKLFPEFEDIRVAAPFPGLEAKLLLCPVAVDEEFTSYWDEADNGKIMKHGAYGEDGSYTHLLTVRRVNHVYNSSCHDFPKNPAGNAAYVNPDDLSALGLSDGDKVKLVSELAEIEVMVEADKSLRRGVVSMAHCFGGDPAETESVEKMGGAAAKLVPVDKYYDPLMGMPRMSALPVKLLKQA